MRGVYRRHAAAEIQRKGSSPLARGLPLQQKHDFIELRIIPACAGFTISSGSDHTVTPDHPRLRGVYDVETPMSKGKIGSSPLARGLPYGCRAESKMQGSSPLARGLLMRSACAMPRPGIIPACAGFTSSRGSPSKSVWDHPRLRGVYRVPRPYRPTRAGSSPLARGLLHLGGDLRDLGGIIPACAGFTIQLTHETNYAAGSSPLARGLLPLSKKLDRIMRIIPACAGFTARPSTSSRRGRDHPRLRGVYS